MSRVEGGVGILEDHLHPAAVLGGPTRQPRRQEAPGEPEFARAVGPETHQRPGEGGLAAAGLADEPEHLAVADVEIDPVQHRRPTVAAGQPPHGQQARPRVRGRA